MPYPKPNHFHVCRHLPESTGCISSLSGEYFSIFCKKSTPKGASSSFLIGSQISRITGMMRGRLLVLFWIYRFKSLRIFSLMTP